MTNGDEPRAPEAGGYAEMNGLNEYYETYGTGRPPVVLHGTYMSIDAVGEVVPKLADTLFGC